MAKAKRDKSEEITFESAMARLEEITRQLEAGEIALDQMIATFREGMELVSYCSKKLEEAELILEKLIGDAGQAIQVEAADLGPEEAE
ncbi:hypothetical protein AMJ71_04645 [candidate division TA06 bacterium SM1_40]|jgi:exodeoxyribonuclease VII small subunit|uniref:Exodeoxyribonuclease 7 small subunit n=2 Tax=Bacteria division TA06 TaxID=1156500 RepID=A0A0S8JJY8_UNCT6|nr:MAG: hypothetical protein AMJ82_11770 [candidate division TA06 bacterium SM23_40]KPL10047.1 MAG: hypothetical protein AMJ71_04645 [candidate division TA06 bacterium SM1_40]